METCIFCKIIKGEIPANKIYEDDKVFAFLDNYPVNKGHTLVIPKKHFENIYEMPNEILCEVIKIAKKLSIVIKKSLKADGINVYMNNDKAAGQQINHAHIHIIPRLVSDGFTYWQSKKAYTREEFKETAEKIIRGL